MDLFCGTHCAVGGFIPRGSHIEMLRPLEGESKGAGSFPAMGFSVHRMTVLPMRIGSRASTLPLQDGWVYSFSANQGGTHVGTES